MKKNYLLVKYEDLISNPKNEFTKIANFIGNLFKLKFTEDQIDSAINLSSFEKLEKMEKEWIYRKHYKIKKTEKIKFFNF